MFSLPRFLLANVRAFPCVSAVASVAWVGLSGCVRAPTMPADAPALVCVVRHTEAYKNLDPLPAGLSQEELDSLTPQGEAQAMALGRELPAVVAGVWSSPYQRTQQTATLIDRGEVVVADALAPLAGEMSWDERTAAWQRGDDPRPAWGESLDDGAERAVPFIAELRGALQPGEAAVLVTHGDLASIILGELRGTYLLDRPFEDTLATGEFACEPLGASSTSASSP